MEAPDDGVAVICALRLGWAVSELRGRLRPGEKLVKITPLGGRLREEHGLPLGGERTALEQLIEAETVVCSLAKRLDLDVVVDESDESGTLASARLIELARALSRARQAGEGPEHKRQREMAWNQLADFLYRWDANMQDKRLPARAGARRDRLARSDTDCGGHRY
jgi:hypothetical protein